MSELINGKTAAQIKVGLKCEIKCSLCSYHDLVLEGKGCAYQAQRDAVELIERLETKVARRDELLKVMGVTVPEEESK